jgi:hypothetical protein
VKIAKILQNPPLLGRLAIFPHLRSRESTVSKPGTVYMLRKSQKSYVVLLLTLRQILVVLIGFFFREVVGSNLEKHPFFVLFHARGKVFFFPPFNFPAGLQSQSFFWPRENGKRGNG